MSNKRIARLEKAVAEMSEQQTALCEQVGRLTRRLEGEDDDPGELIRFLDRFRAGEALGEASLGAWIAVSDTECLRGGLRTLQMREGMHARLLEQRIKELGGAPRFEIPESVYSSVMEGSGDEAKSDAEKVLEFVQRFPDIDAALAPIYEEAEKADAETGSLLRTIAQDERSTLEFLNEACALLNPS